MTSEPVDRIAATRASAGIHLLRPRRDRLRYAGPYVVAAALTLAGVQVSLAPEGAAYDLIADFPSTGPRRIQVKTVMSDSCQCNLSRKVYCGTGHGGHRRALYTADAIDYFACVTFAGAVYLIPIDAVAGRYTISLRGYSAFRLDNYEQEVEGSASG
ncbi:MAG TPA: group I intron-associated PD-(D/E)XK endonuclease [Mycobacteriales bacterium]|nr:group I intron-associated PD-(D/E)XK endonuclease [Mycobacteriales bacterium]